MKLPNSRPYTTTFFPSSDRAGSHHVTTSVNNTATTDAAISRATPRWFPTATAARDCFTSLSHHAHRIIPTTANTWNSTPSTGTLLGITCRIPTASSSSAPFTKGSGTTHDGLGVSREPTGMPSRNAGTYDKITRYATCAKTIPTPPHNARAQRGLEL